MRHEMEATGKDVDIRELKGGKYAANPHACPTPSDHEDFLDKRGPFVAGFNGVPTTEHSGSNWGHGGSSAPRVMRVIKQSGHLISSNLGFLE